MVITLVIIVLLVLIAAGVPIGFSMAFSGCLGLWLVGGSATLLGLVSSTPLTTVSTYELLSIPLFLLMAEFVIASGIADEMYDCMCIWTGRVPGGLAIATALAGAGFGAITGSSTASAATLAATSLPAMIRHGYDRHLSTGVVAISGTLAMLVPPSLALVIYGLLTDLSIGKLLIAGIVPAAFVTVAIILTVLGLVALDPRRAPRGRSYTWGQKLLATRATGPMVLLIVLVTGAIYTGLATPTESSALGVFGAFLISVVRGRMSWSLFVAALVGAARTAAMISMIIIGAHLFGYALTLTQSTQGLVNWIGGLGANRYVVIALILLLKLVLGFFMDQLAIQLLTVPIMVPIIVSLGFDPVWFGVMIVLTAEVGMVTPPVGMNAFIVARYTGRPVEEVFWGSAPHVVVHLALIVLFVIFPAIVTWLPGTMAP
jgi:C4-dicarboxylate transporter DctM subunit